MIRITNLQKSFLLGPKKNMVLKNVNLEINKGEMVAIMGRSGSGKSTLLNILAGLVKADSGSYHFDNNDVLKMDSNQVAEFRKCNIGYVFQNSVLIDTKDVYHNIVLPLKYSNYSKSEEKKKISLVLAALHIEKLKHNSIDTLSGGEGQRVAIARAIIQDPKVIIADEPTGSLDEKTEEDILRLFTIFNKQGKTIIIVTHNQKVADSCDRIFYIENGCCNLFTGY
ncbi:peptide ABC transporter ATP-binding protein [Paenibacillus etheri]|uniref:Peptide ABC transporter ATP-binding protein n=1 Tax=Paenibacillus etheri TaxID=1306852 RepID=A0A0W1B461_9BACL|nr:ABC transporter ATP-binding protein [Paenibacillus etheri]KTD88340.1 peptide ABC transporter ATP-binding protein [Paenibacillus etheri]